MANRNNPINIPDYRTREARIKSINRFSINDLFTVSNIATLLFVALDFAVLYSRWETVQTESWYFVALIALSSAVILDVPMMLAGKKIVEYQNRLASKTSTVVIVLLSAIAFLLVFVFSIWFSYVTRNATFQDAEASTLINNMAALNQSESGNSVSVLVAALYSGVLPLGTSIASLVIALMTTKPNENKLKKITAARVLAEEHLIHIRQGIAENNVFIERGRGLLARENDLYRQFVDSVYAQELIRKQAYREALEEKCTPDEINHIIETSADVNSNSPFDDNPDIETAEYVTGDLTKGTHLSDIKSAKISA